MKRYSKMARRLRNSSHTCIAINYLDISWRMLKIAFLSI